MGLFSPVVPSASPEGVPVGIGTSSLNHRQVPESPTRQIVEVMGCSGRLDHQASFSDLQHGFKGFTPAAPPHPDVPQMRVVRPVRQSKNGNDAVFYGGPEPWAWHSSCPGGRGT